MPPLDDDASLRAYRARLADAAAAARLDDDFAKLHADLARRLAPPCLLSRPTRALVTAWASHLAAPAPVLAWKKARNDAARALVAGLASGALPPPFNRRPPDGGPGARVVVAGAAAAAANPRPAIRAGRGGDAATTGAQPGPSGRGHATPTPSPSTAHPPHLPPCMLPTALELQAALGAARERAAELEWRLGEAEARAEGVARAAGAAAAAAAAAATSTSTAPSAARAVLDAARRRADRERQAKADSENWWAAAGASPPSLVTSTQAAAAAATATVAAARKRRAAPLEDGGGAGVNAKAGVGDGGGAADVKKSASPPSLNALRGRIHALGRVGL